jgi:FkbM family methyltransferase
MYAASSIEVLGRTVSPSNATATLDSAPTPGAGEKRVRWDEELPGLLGSLRLPAAGVVQVGAHVGQEVAMFSRCGFRRLVLMEPNRDHLPALHRQLADHHERALLPAPECGLPSREVVVAAAGRRRGWATLHVTEYDQQASVLPPLRPMSVVREDGTAVIPLREVQRGCNVLVVDAQGAELDVLAGADLDGLDLAVIEGSSWPRYDGGATLMSIAAFMRDRGWQPIASWAHARPNVVDVAWLAPGLGC